MLALGTDTFGILLWPVPGPDLPLAPAQAPLTFLRSITPALDLAFGLSDLSDVGADLAGWIARLEAEQARVLSDAVP